MAALAIVARTNIYCSHLCPHGAVQQVLARLSKVSKPIALAADSLEAYSAIIILFVVRMLGSSSSGVTSGSEQAMLSAGIGSMPIDLLES